jgi:hypothetical protein
MQKLSTFLGVVVIVGVAIACGGDDDDPPTTTATAPAAATSAATPTALTAATPTGAASATSAATATAEPAATSTPPETGDAEVQARLARTALALDDMPTGWTQVDMTDDEPDTDETAVCGNPPYPNRDNRLGEVEVGFQQSEIGPFVFQNLVEFPEEDALGAMEYAREIASCTEWTETDEDGVEQTYRLAPLEVGDFGDDTYANVVSLDIEGVGTLVNNTVFVRVGNTLTVIVHSQIGEPDLDETEGFVQAAVEKMEANAP